MITTILLIISTVFNVFFVWYIIQLLKRLLSVSDNMEDFFEVLEEYNSHIDVVYNLERFYGDDTLERLLKHSKTVLEEAGALREIYDTQYEVEELEEVEE
jgi:hypothetical protein